MSERTRIVVLVNDSRAPVDLGAQVSAILTANRTPIVIARATMETLARCLEEMSVASYSTVSVVFCSRKFAQAARDMAREKPQWRVVVVCADAATIGQAPERSPMPHEHTLWVDEFHEATTHARKRLLSAVLG